MLQETFGISKHLIGLIGSSLRSETPDSQFLSLSDEEIAGLYVLSKKHDLAHIAGKALREAGVNIPEEYAAKFRKCEGLAVYRYAAIQAEWETVTLLLSQMDIAHMPLKGTVIRHLYPFPEMRTSSDIDILLHKEDVERAVKLLTEEHGYRLTGKTVYDVSLFSQSGVHVELHFSLSEDDPHWDDVLLTAWDSAMADETVKCRYQMSSEMFYVYCIAHMAKHFLHGGCGIKPFMDLWVIDTRMKYDEKKADEMLDTCGLLTFSQKVQQLVNVWFSGGEHTELTREMEDYILGGGVYGTKENKAAMASAKNGSRFCYMLTRIFLPYRRLKVAYPMLEKYPILYPFYLCKRWLRILFSKDRRNAVNELKKTAAVNESQKQRFAMMCEDLNLL